MPFIDRSPSLQNCIILCTLVCARKSVFPKQFYTDGLGVRDRLTRGGDGQYDVQLGQTTNHIHIVYFQ